MSKKLYHILWRTDDSDVLAMLTDVYLDETIDANTLNYDDWAAMALREYSDGEQTEEDVAEGLRKGVDVYAVIEGPANFII